MFNQAQTQTSLACVIFASLFFILTPAQAAPGFQLTATASPTSLQAQQTEQITAMATANQDASNYNLVFSVTFNGSQVASTRLTGLNFTANKPLTKTFSWIIPANASLGTYVATVSIKKSGTVYQSIATTSVVTGATAVNGTCGSSGGQAFSVQPTTNLCSAGIVSGITGTGSWIWQCNGSNGGSTASCSASALLAQINGVCGSINGGTSNVAPTTNLCSAGTASAVTGSGPWAWNCIGSNGGSTASCSVNVFGQVTGRAVPSPIYGVTLDDVSNVSAELNSLQQLVHTPTTRIVFDTSEPASYYLAPIQQFRNSSYIMGLLADSSYMPKFTASSITTWAQNYTETLGNNVDIWEVGNEVNGNWLGSNTMAKIEAMYDVVSGKGGATALTFFYEGEPSEANNCIATNNGGNDMFTWITQQFQLNLPVNQRPVETEKIRLNLNYALISWYPNRCPGETPNWPWVYSQLASIFPNAKVGFGELGTANPQNGSAYEVNEINKYYPMAKTVAGLPSSYIGGYFWWYFAEEMVPWGKNILSSTLNGAMQ